MNALSKVAIIFPIFCVAILFLECNPGTVKEVSNNQPDSSATAKDSHAEKQSARPVHWTYSGEDGPENWASLSPVYAACGQGRSQSPVDLGVSVTHGKVNMELNYKTTSLNIAHNELVDDIIDNGHTIQITAQPGSILKLGDKVYHLKQLHFHTPSEHTLDGKHLLMEMHMVHQSDDGKLAVVGVLIEEGAENRNIAKIIPYLPNAPGETKHLADVHIELNLQIPANREAYHYIGSLTTPPCSENVEWLVLKQKLKFSAAQIQAFSSRIHNNSRPVQPLNDRKIVVDKLK
jgi:carbonic anhydrase